jgi:Uma2 family endonuclease
MIATATAAPSTLDDFLAWEQAQELRCELVDGVVRVMAGATEGLDRISCNCLIAIGTRLRGSSCSVHGSNLKVVSRAAGAVMYPDLLARCGPRDDRRTSVDDPVLVVEVLSEGTARHDLIRKRIAYEAMPGLARIVYVAVDEARIDMRVRGSDGHWRDETVMGLDASLSLPEIGVTVPLAEVYADSEVAASA